MKCMDCIRNAGKALGGASLVLGLMATGAEAVDRPSRPYYQQQCPPGYSAPSSPYYTPTPAPRPGQPTPAPRPGDMAPMAPMPGDMGPQQPDQAQAQQPDQAQQPSDFTPSPESSGRASLSPGMNTPQLGRLDAANRLNLFDNMVAMPVNKVWFGFQYASGITTGIEPFSSALLPIISADPILGGSGDLFAEQKEIIYRVGAEVLLDCNTSIAVQGQYWTNETDDSPYGDDWSNPQIMLKYVLARDCDTVLSATLGVTPETDVDFGDFKEDTTKIYPGMLFYETLDRDLFTQGGFQFGIPTEDDQITHFDWSLSVGYWAFRDCSLVCGNCCCNGGQITGIIPQIGLLGKHVLGDETRFNAFGIPSSGSVPGGPTLVIYREPRDVIDLTVGTLIIIGCDVQVGVGYSFPITDDETRENEFLSYVNYLF
jgi:hypothetical protein